MFLLERMVVTRRILGSGEAKFPNMLFKFKVKRQKAKVLQNTEHRITNDDEVWNYALPAVAPKSLSPTGNHLQFATDFSTILNPLHGIRRRQ